VALRRLLAAAAAALGLALLVSGGPAPAAYPGANGKITFYSTRNGSPEIFVSKAGGEGEHGFTPPAIGYYPSFSPNAKKIAYQSTGGEQRIVVMRADGTGRHAITPEEDFSRDPAFGFGLIAFAHDTGDNEEIFLVRPDGTHRRNLTRRPGDDFAPAWSPNGKRIVFTHANKTTFDLFAINVRTRDVKRITRTDEIEENEASWSPDGKRIAFTRYINDTGQYDIGIVRADGSHRRRLTSDSTFDAYPAFSPNGRKLAFSREGPEEIYVMDLRSGDFDPITDNAGQDVGPDWGVGRR
jgi:TolB protein